MLARANRVTHPADFRATMRRGRRVVAPHAVLHFLDRQRDSPSRFGFVVGKAVGGAVTRNLVRRRLRSLCRESLTVIGPGHDVVVRALPGSHEVPWATLHAEIVDAIDRGVKKR